jgi:hypothetical protein
MPAVRPGPPERGTSAAAGATVPIEHQHSVPPSVMVQTITAASGRLLRVVVDWQQLSGDRLSGVRCDEHGQCSDVFRVDEAL